MCWVDNIYRWLEISITCSGELAEALAETMSRYIKNGVAIESLTTFDTADYEFKATGDVKVSVYLENDSSLDLTRQKIEEAVWHFSQIVSIPEPQFREISDEDWMASWKRHYQPIYIGKKFLVLPAWIDAKPDEKRTVIRIDPAMAFGTGTHPSTQLCLLAIEDYLEQGVDVIDLGCGSGILAIAALKHGAEYALAVDTDQNAVDATRTNASLNNIEDNLGTYKGSLDDISHGNYPLTQASFVLANILAPVIIKLFKEGLAKTLKPDGIMVLAGILENQAEQVLTAIKTSGLRLLQQYQINDWVALVVTHD